MADDPWSEFRVQATPTAPTTAVPQTSPGGDPWAEFRSKQQPGAAPPSQPYSLGPISDVAELGARGINYLAQNYLPESLRPAPRAPGPIGTPVNLPFIGQPSATGLAKGMYESAVSGATLPGDVYAGRVDPLSPEGIRRATDLASITPLSSVPGVAYRAPQVTAPLSSDAIKGAATATYDAIRDQSRAVPLSADYLRAAADDVGAWVNQIGPRAKTAGAAHTAINDIAKPASRGDLGDLVESFRELGKVARENPGDNIAAANMARDRLGGIIDAIQPGLTNTLREADKNYAIAAGSRTVQEKIAKAVEDANQAGLGGNVGNRIRQQFKLGGDVPAWMTPEVEAAYRRVTDPGMGVNTLRNLSGFDPTQSRLGMLMGMGQLAATPFTGGWSTIPMAAGAAARPLYDRMMQNRAAQISQALRAEAPATLAQPGYTSLPGGVLGQQLPMMPSWPTGVLSIGAPRQQPPVPLLPQYL